MRSSCRTWNVPAHRRPVAGWRPPPPPLGFAARATLKTLPEPPENVAVAAFSFHGRGSTPSQSSRNWRKRSAASAHESRLGSPTVMVYGPAGRESAPIVSLCRTLNVLGHAAAWRSAPRPGRPQPRRGRRRRRAGGALAESGGDHASSVPAGRLPSSVSDTHFAGTTYVTAWRERIDEPVGDGGVRSLAGGAAQQLRRRARRVCSGTAWPGQRCSGSRADSSNGVVIGSSSVSPSRKARRAGTGDRATSRRARTRRPRARSSGAARARRAGRGGPRSNAACASRRSWARAGVGSSCVHGVETRHWLGDGAGEAGSNASARRTRRPRRRARRRPSARRRRPRAPPSPRRLA